VNVVSRANSSPSKKLLDDRIRQPHAAFGEQAIAHLLGERPRIGAGQRAEDQRAADQRLGVAHFALATREPAAARNQLVDIPALHSSPLFVDAKV